ncbi:MAG: porin [Rhodospirillaceae bacterium]
MLNLVRRFSLSAALICAAAPAYAAEAITLSVGGYVHQYFFVADQDEAPGENFNVTGMFTDARVSFDGRSVLDNGIIVRAYARLFADTQAQTNADEVYIEVISSLGRLRLGEMSGASTAIIGDPVPQAFLTVYDEVIGDALMPRTGITLQDAFTFRRFTGNALGITYRSPELLGFQLGVAYHPTPQLISGPINNTFASNNAVDVTARYQGYYPGGSYRLAAGYFHMSPSSLGFGGIEAWNASAGLTYGGWELAGAYMDVVPNTGGREHAWTVGAFYGLGPWQISADYRAATRKPLPNSIVREHVDRATLQTAYSLGPGISVGLAGFYAEQDDSTGATWNGGGVLGGIRVGF